MEGCRRKPRRCPVHREVWGAQDRIKRRDRNKGKARAKQQNDEHVKGYGGLREEIGMKTYLHDPMDYAKTLKLRFRVGDLGLPERRKRYTSNREEEEKEEDLHMCPCSKTIEYNSHSGKCKMYKEERDLLDIRKIDEHGMEKFGTLDSSEKTIAIRGD